jgi:N-acetyl sugar amidotransferase
MDDSDKEIKFDSNGECNYCKIYQNFVNENRPGSIEAVEKLHYLASQIKREGKGKPYDCIMGLSGGIDSSYLAWYCVTELKLRPLVVHVDSGWNSELAVKNIENIVKKLKIELHTLVLDWEEVKDLQRSFFKASVPNCDIPQDYAFYVGLYQEAEKFGIKYILNGSNMSTESILPNSWGYDSKDLRHLKSIHKKFGKLELKNYPTISFIKKTILFPYLYRFKVISPLDYLNYNKENAKEILTKELDWTDYGGKHFESIFTKFFQSYYLPKKFNFDKRKAHLSSLIASNQISRPQALAEINNVVYQNEIDFIRDLEYFLKKLDFSKAEWDEIMSNEPVPHSFYPNEVNLLKFVNLFIQPLLKVRSFFKN